MKVCLLSKESTSTYFKRVAYIFNANLKGWTTNLKTDAYIAIAPSVKEFNCLFLNLNEVMSHLPFDMMT